MRASVSTGDLNTDTRVNTKATLRFRGNGLGGYGVTSFFVASSTLTVAVVVPPTLIQ